MKPAGREKLGMDIGRTPEARARMKACNQALRAQGIDPNQGPGRTAWGATPLFPELQTPSDITFLRRDAKKKEGTGEG